MYRLIAALAFLLPLTANATPTYSPVIDLSHATGVTINVLAQVHNGDADATASFQRAAAAVGSGATIEIPPGSYTISGTTTLTSNTRVHCEAGAVITAAAAASWSGGAITYAFQATTGSNFEVQGCQFAFPEGSSLYGGGPSHILQFLNVTNVSVHDNTFDGGADAVANRGVTSLRVLNNKATNSSNSCYDNWDSFTDAQVNMNECSITNGGAGVAGLAFTGITNSLGAATSVGFQVIGNTISMATAEGQCISINGFASGGQDDRGIITGNKCYTVGSVHTWGALVTGHANNITIADNQFYDGGGAYGAVKVASPATNVLVHDNYAYNWQAGGTGIFTNLGTGGSLHDNIAISSSSPLIGGASASIVNYGNDSGSGSASPGQPYFQAYLSSSNQTGMTTATPTKVLFNATNFDSCSCYDSATNHRYTPTVAGKYLVTVQVQIQTGGGTGAGNMGAFIYKNGSEVARNLNQTPNTNSYANGYGVTQIVTLNGSTDYIEGWGETTGTSALAFTAGTNVTFFEASYIGP